MPESSAPPSRASASPWDFSPASASWSPASSRTGRSPTASPGPAGAKAPSSPSATRASASRSASPSSPPSSARRWSSTATSPTTPRSRRCSRRWARPGRPSTASSTRSASRPRKRSPATSSRACRARRSGSPTTSRATASRRWPRRRPPRLAPGSALLTLTYLGALRSVPNYNTMGLAKASLEASVRYLAASLGAEGRARQRHLGRADQDAGRVGHQGLRQDPRRRRRERAAAPQRDDRRRRQRRRVPAVRPGRRRHLGDHLRRRRLQPRDAGAHSRGPQRPPALSSGSSAGRRPRSST